MSDTRQDLLNLNARIEYTQRVLSQLITQRSMILAAVHATYVPTDSLDQETADREYDEAFEGRRH